jgi:hypothetical protein
MPVTVPYVGATELAHAVQSAIATADTTTAFSFLCGTTAIQCINSPSALIATNPSAHSC